MALLPPPPPPPLPPPHVGRGCFHHLFQIHCPENGGLRFLPCPKAPHCSFQPLPPPHHLPQTHVATAAPPMERECQLIILSRNGPHHHTLQGLNTTSQQPLPDIEKYALVTMEREQANRHSSKTIPTGKTLRELKTAGRTADWIHELFLRPQYWCCKRGTRHMCPPHWHQQRGTAQMRIIRGNRNCLSLGLPMPSWMRPMPQSSC